MRRKIEILSDDPLVTESAEVEATTPDAESPDEIDHSDSEDSPGEANSESGTETASREGTQPLNDGANAYITALQAEMEELRVQKEEAEKRFVYLQAEFQNYRRRKDEEGAGMVRFANSELIKSLLPALDNFERALQAAEQTRNFDALIGGVAGTLKQIQTFLQKAGVTSIEAKGQEFDPNFHEAIGRVEAEGLPANTVAEEVQRGYMMHDRVLRPALVRVTE